jgi:hypothetical protein
VVRGTLATVGIAIAVLLVLPVAGTFHVIDDWLPSTLVNAPVDLVSGAHQLPHYLSALGVIVAATGAGLRANRAGRPGLLARGQAVTFLAAQGPPDAVPALRQQAVQRCGRVGSCDVLIGQPDGVL